MAKFEISNKDAYDAYENKKHLKMRQAGVGANNMPQQAPDVRVNITNGGKRASIRYAFDLSVVASDEDGLDDVENLISGLLQDASAAGISAGGIPSDPMQIIKLTFKTIRRIRDIWKVDQRSAQLATRDMKIKLAERNGKTVSIKTTIMVDASWMANDPTEWGSYAWMELEMHRMTGIVEHQGTLPDDLDDLTRTRGIVPWNPANGSDLIGAFNSNIHQCTEPVDRDEFLFTADVTCNAISDDDVVAIIIRSMTIELEILPDEKAEGEDKGTSGGEKKKSAATTESKAAKTKAGKSRRVESPARKIRATDR